MTSSTAVTALRLQTVHLRVPSSRRVVLVNPATMAEMRLRDDDLVDLVALASGQRASGFRAVTFPTAPGAVATYFPPFPRSEGAPVQLVP
jgi:anaerobic selenocysteine-containing dehydrogenase